MWRGINSFFSVSDQQTGVTWEGVLKDPEQANKREPRHPFLQSVFTFLNLMALVYVRLIDKRIEKARKRILKY